MSTPLATDLLASPSSSPFARRMGSLRPSAIREILKTTEAPDVISFAGGLPAPEFFPVEEIQAATEYVLGKDARSALQYGVTEGYTPLRLWIAEHLAQSVGLKANSDHILVTQGSQQGLDLLGKTLLDPGDTVLLENPAYLGAIQAFQAYEAHLVGLPCDNEGLLPDALADFLANATVQPKFLYLVSNYQNPTGKSMSRSRRAEIVAIALRHDLLIIEDDPYGRLRFEGEALPALGAIDSELRWVYLGSTSKVLAPGLRVAWMATSDRTLFERLVTAKQAADLQTGSFTQRIVHRLLTDKVWIEKHLAALCHEYAARRDVMLLALQRELPSGATWTHPSGGLFLWVTLPEVLDTLELLKAASEHKVAFVPGAPFWVGEIRRNTLRLNFSNASTDKIELGIKRLGSLINTALSHAAE